MRCWRCGGSLVDYGNELGVHCMMCCRTPDQEYWEEVERLKSRKHGNPKTYGTSTSYRHEVNLEEYVISKLERMCRG